MKTILNNLLERWSRKTVNDIRLPVSRLAQLWDMGKDITGSHKDRPSDPYSQVDTVWTCVNLIIDVASGVQLMISTADDDIIESGPVYDFLFNNPDMNYQRFLTETLGFYSLFREVYWWYTDMDLIRPTNIRVVSPRQMTPLTDSSGQLVGYEFRSGGQKINLAPEEVFCIKNFNPANPHRGSGPLDAGTLSISVAYQATLYNESSLANGARLSTILSAPPGAGLSDPEIAKMRREFKSRQGGAKNAANVFFAQGGVTVDTVSQTMADLQMMEISKYTDQKICSLFGVPPECVVLVTEAQYAQGPATQRLILYGVAPLLSALAEGIDDGILARYRFKHYQNAAVPFAASKRFCGCRQPLRSKALYRHRKLKAIQGNKTVFAWFDVDSHPAIQEMLRQRTEKMLPFVEKGVPLNQVIDAADLPFDTTKMPWGDQWWVSAGLMPAQWILDGGMEAVTGPSQPEGEEDDEPQKTIEQTAAPIDREKSTRIWQKWAASWQPLEREFKEAVRQFLRRQKSDTVKRLEVAWDQSKSIAKDAEDLITRIQFDLRTENGKIRAIHNVFYERGIKLGAAQTVSEVTGASGAALKETAEQVARRQAVKRTLTVAARKIENINKTTQDLIARTMREGLSNGEGLPELAKRIQDSSAFNINRAARIARTNTGSAVSAGRHEAAKHIGADRKSWLTSKDENVRKTHTRCEKETKDGIPIDEPFVLGGMAFLMHPGDPNGPAGEVVNCRCMEIVRRANGKAFSLDHYDLAAILAYNEFKSLLTEAQNGN